MASLRYASENESSDLMGVKMPCCRSGRYNDLAIGGMLRLMMEICSDDVARDSLLMKELTLLRLALNL